MNKLTPRQKEILKLRRNRYLIPDIAKKYKTTKQNIWGTLQGIAKKGYEIEPKKLEKIEK